MTKSTKETIVTKTFLQKLKARNIPAACASCGKPLKEGQKVVIRRYGRSGINRKRHHKHCYDNMFV